MIPRQQLPVHSPIRASGLASAARSAFLKDTSSRERVAERLAETFDASEVVLTDSGTSALVLALRAIAGEGRTVALPAYGCVDLVAAAIHVRSNVRLYDIDPRTLSPDLDSVSRVLERGVDAIVIAHLYGYPADVRAVASLANEYGVPVVEDAAQGAGGTLLDRRLGSFGPLTVLSFGRGKGVTGGRGGALLRTGAVGAMPRLALERPRAGWGDLSLATAQWIFGRPTAYALPTALPGLRLGEMVYRPAHQPGALSIAAAELVRDALEHADRELANRRRNAESLMTELETVDGVTPIQCVAGGASGYLRLAIRDARDRGRAPELGILRGYPRTLAEQAEMREWLARDEVVPSGAKELSRTLLTLPVHKHVTGRDLERLIRWLRARAAGQGGSTLPTSPGGNASRHPWEAPATPSSPEHA